MTKLLTKAHITKLKSNWDKSYEHCRPVVRFFGGGDCQWIIFAMDEDNDTLVGWCDLGQGNYPEYGYVSLTELQSLRFRPFGLGIERDQSFKPTQSMKKYIDDFKAEQEAEYIRDFGRGYHG